MLHGVNSSGAGVFVLHCHLAVLLNFGKILLITVQFTCLISCVIQLN